MLMCAVSFILLVQMEELNLMKKECSENTSDSDN